MTRGVVSKTLEEYLDRFNSRLSEIEKVVSGETDLSKKRSIVYNLLSEFMDGRPTGSNKEELFDRRSLDTGQRFKLLDCLRRTNEIMDEVRLDKVQKEIASKNYHEIREKPINPIINGIGWLYDNAFNFREFWIYTCGTSVLGMALGSYLMDRGGIYVGGIFGGLFGFSSFLACGEAYKFYSNFKEMRKTGKQNTEFDLDDD